jgi:GTP-binding protein
MFVDEIKIKVRGGSGGNGCVSFRHEKYVPKGGPAGGDGADGGSVILRAVTGQQSLVDLYYLSHYEGRNGEHGRGKDQYGRRGEPRIVDVPVGTIVKDPESGELLADLCAAGQEYVAAKGGKGGRGNIHFTTPTNRAPQIAEPGGPGEERYLRLELKTVANVGLVGYPNAGKSTLIGAVSSAHPKTGPYPFTTKNPVVGVIEFPDYYRFTMADIPGLIDGAHANIGLGHDFLRHVERCQVLVYVLDTAGADGRDPRDDLTTLERELELYQEGLSRRARLIVANKMDLPEAAGKLAELQARAGLPIVPVSALNKTHLDDLLAALRNLLEAAALADGVVSS